MRRWAEAARRSASRSLDEEENDDDEEVGCGANIMDDDDKPEAA